MRIIKKKVGFDEYEYSLPYETKEKIRRIAYIVGGSVVVLGAVGVSYKKTEGPSE